jgi:hypothetical protein
MALFAKPSKTKPSAAETVAASSNEGSVKYPKPKILLLDMADSASTALRFKGFNVICGTLGKPYKVGKSSRYQALIAKGDAPNHTEQEIVVVDFGYGDLEPGPRGEKHRPDDEPDLWGKCDQGFLDPRVRTSIHLQKSFDRIHSNGGVFIVFADQKTGIHIQFARRSQFNELYDQTTFPHDVWDVLSDIADMQVRNDHGTEMHGAKTNSPLVRLLAPFLVNGQFTCTLEGGYRREDEWEPLAVNKFGAVVALARCRAGKGSVIVVPQIEEKAAFLDALFSTALPEIAPHLFPHIAKGVWTHWPEYELPRVLELKSQQEEVEQRARGEIARLDGELEAERTKQGWINNLITGTDTELVNAVKLAFSELGFLKVVDVDADRDRESKSRREDLQIEDQSPTLVIDIKGIGGFPSDEDALQADKHAAIRMREQKRTDIVGLSIINHQRHLPPLERENAMPFRQELIDAAEERSLGLLTAWELYRFVRNLRKLGWDGANVKPVFYKKGRIDVVPVHYQLIGKIAKAWTDKFGVVIENGELRIGERIAIEFPIEFEEIQVDSIRVNGESVQIASVGDPAGLLWLAGAPKLREGMRVFRIVVPT